MFGLVRKGFEEAGAVLFAVETDDEGFKRKSCYSGSDETRDGALRE